MHGQAGVFALVFLGAMSNVGAASPPPMIGIGYEVWFPGIPGGPKFWANRWGADSDEAGHAFQ